MSEKIKYTDEPLGDLRVVPDVLPRPEELIFRDEGVKVTIALSKRSVEFFKSEARKHHTQYQRMIRGFSMPIRSIMCELSLHAQLGRAG